MVSVALVSHRTNNRKVVGSMPANKIVMCLRFTNRIDKYWNNFEFKYNWKADPTGLEAVVKFFS